VIEPAWTVPVPGGRVRVRCSERADGDFHLDHVDPVVLEARRRALVDLPWTMLDEVHGVDVVQVVAPGAADRTVGDVAWTEAADAVLGVWVGDCAPIVLVAPSGRFAVVHAGWRGLALGVLAVGVGAVTGHDPARRTDGRDGVVAWLGPRIGPCCYEFGPDDLAAVAAGTGLAVEQVRGTTRWGSAALDVPAAVVGGLARLGVATVDSGWCTGCDPRFHSHRIDGDPGRHVVAAWKEVRGS
jgi:copper oxidase (laccase) domain-containing protein